jgi:hypothetical protein
MSGRFFYRRVLPIAQLLICTIVLWPSRYFVLFQLSQLIQKYVPASAERQNPPINIEIPTLTSKQLEEADRAARMEQVRMDVPVALNFPVLIAQLPYIVPLRREWVPGGMMRETWRALSWPVIGIFFWWLAGRGADALCAIRKSGVTPRITMAETIFAGLVFGMGVASLVGILTSTPDDRRDIYFLGLIAGGILWGCLAMLTIAARLLQWRLLRKRTAVAVLA